MRHNNNVVIDNDLLISYETYIIKNNILLENPYKFSVTTSKHFHNWLEFNGFDEKEIKVIKKLINFESIKNSNIYESLNLILKLHSKGYLYE